MGKSLRRVLKAMRFLLCFCGCYIRIVNNESIELQRSQPLNQCKISTFTFVFSIAPVTSQDGHYLPIGSMHISHTDVVLQQDIALAQTGSFGKS